MGFEVVDFFKIGVVEFPSTIAYSSPTVGWVWLVRSFLCAVIVSVWFSIVTKVDKAFHILQRVVFMSIDLSD